MARFSLKNHLLYGGVSKEEYENIKPLIAEENLKIWKIFSVVLEILFIGIFIFVLVEDNHAAYILPIGILAGSMVLLGIGFLIMRNSKNKVLLPMIYLSVILMLGIFIYVGVFVERGRPTVIFPALIIGLSCVTLDRPVRFTSTMFVLTIIHVLLVLFFKNGAETKFTDILCGSVFSIGGIVLCIVYSSFRMRNLMLRSAAEKDRDTDALTNVSNKMAYDRKVSEIEHQMFNDNFKFAVAIFDVNGLKKTNDTFGHDQGDKLLIRCCQMIQGSLHHTTIYRIGGDEFAAIITGEDYANRERIVREIHENIEKAYAQSTSLLDDTSVAFGVAVFNPKKDRDYLSVFSRADAEMYANKRVTKAKNVHLQDK